LVELLETYFPFWRSKYREFFSLFWGKGCLDLDKLFW